MTETDMRTMNRRRMKRISRMLMTSKRTCSTLLQNVATPRACRDNVASRTAPRYDTVPGGAVTAHDVMAMYCARSGELNTRGLFHEAALDDLCMQYILLYSHTESSY